MEKKDENAITWAIKKYWREKPDEWIAKGLSVPLEQVIQMRQELGLTRYKPGTESLKEFARRYLMEMSEEAKVEFISKLSPDLIWKMAEGNPATTGELTINTEPIRIDITHQLLKVYGPNDGRIAALLPRDSEKLGITSGAGE